MKYILTDGPDDGVAALADRLARELAVGKHVLWLVSGGSNTTASVAAMENIPPDLSRNLSVMPVDERYGTPGHKDSNWAQLMAANFNAKQATILPVLQDGLNFEQTIERYDQLAAKAFADNDIVIAQLGVGADGHIAGILPDSAAANETQALVAGYQSQPYARLTLTFPGLRGVNAAYTFAFGASKQQALTSLINETLPLTKQPAQILKELPEAYVYNDQAGDNEQQ